MPTLDPWLVETITRETLFVALRTIQAPQAVRDWLKPDVPEDKLPDEAVARAAFLQAAAMPEQRTQLAKAIALEYSDLTHWVIRADLMRVEGIAAEAAWGLALAGVAGVHDLGAWTASDKAGSQPALSPALTWRRLRALWKNFFTALHDSRHPSTLLTPETRRMLKGKLKALEPERLSEAARKLPSQIISDTSAILVVKGAGIQKPDETLDVFLRGFWPAVCSINPEASLTKRHDIFPAGYRSSAYDKEPLNQVTEVRNGERRVWIKEANWETTVNPPNPFGSLFSEWRMATYAFGSMIHELFEARDTGVQPSMQEEATDFWRCYWAFALMFGLVLLHVVLGVFWARVNGYLLWGALNQIGVGAWAVILLSFGLSVPLLAAAPLARETVRRKKERRKGKGLPALPGLPNWVLLLLIAAFVVSPAGYLLWLLAWVTVQLALLRARAMTWPYREFSNSDSIIYDYYSVSGEINPATGQPRVYKRSNRSARARRIFVLIYRYLVILGLPISFLFLSLIWIVKLIPPLREWAADIEQTLSLILSSVLGDVVGYAMDPAQAHRVRSAVEADLRFFHDRPEVSSLHVFAHSQGTPITFEVLFRHLPDAYRRKIKTYVTIGSVLSYLHQANPILDPVYVRRFPVNPYPDFAEGFKWINFWNLADPITEFYGLDEYNQIKHAPLRGRDSAGRPMYPAHPEEIQRKIKRHPASPTNFKTRATWQNHGEYWGNLTLVQTPFAARVFGDLRPPEWNPSRERLRGPLAHHQWVLLLWTLWLILFFPGVWALNLAWTTPAIREVFRWLIEAQVVPLAVPTAGPMRDLLNTLGAFVGAVLVSVLIYLPVLAGLNAVYLALLRAYAGLRARLPQS